MLVRRSAYLFFFRQEGPFAGVPALFRRAGRNVPRGQLYALPILTGVEHAITAHELEALLAIPSDRWSAAAGLPPESQALDLRDLALNGLIVTDEPDAEPAALRERELALARIGWNVYPALFHFMTRWRGVNATEYGEAERAPADYVAQVGQPPPTFKAYPAPLGLHDLPTPQREHPLYDVLARRRTARGFDTSRQLSLDDLGALLKVVFGAQATMPIFGVAQAVKKTSPSGGALHPIEAYPLIRSVGGIEPGLYHYDVERHALALIERFTDDAARRLSAEFTQGQTWFADAHASFILTARFDRHLWKYRGNARSYAVMLMDAAHLSQTLYLVATELGLGGFVTAAINNGDIDDRLGLDPVREGAIAICGVGIAANSPLDPEFEEYIPRRTVV